MAKFRLLHITDLHISVPPDEDEMGSRLLWMGMQTISPSRARRPVLQAVADLVFRMRDSIDTIVISGDLADDGELRNLETALDFLDEPPQGDTYLTIDEFPTLRGRRGDEMELFVMPGNHDRFTGLGRAPGGTEFDKIFKSF
jgi:3',5'-cyclic AMP phosphodiesterase CpdA